jgi:hypothetical protein
MPPSLMFVEEDDPPITYTAVLDPYPPHEKHREL